MCYPLYIWNILLLEPERPINVILTLRYCNPYITWRDFIVSHRSPLPSDTLAAAVEPQDVTTTNKATLKQRKFMLKIFFFKFEI